MEIYSWDSLKRSYQIVQNDKLKKRSANMNHVTTIWTSVSWIMHRKAAINMTTVARFEKY